MLVRDKPRVIEGKGQFTGDCSSHLDSFGTILLRVDFDPDDHLGLHKRFDSYTKY
jgi:hypothetical protein